MKGIDHATAEGILFTDLYQITMAQLYFRMGLHEKTTQFDHFFRKYPDYGIHQAGYCINAGLEWLLDWMASARFREKDLDHLRAQRGRTGKPLFGEDFLSWLGKNGGFESLSMQAVPEGRVVHPGAPLTVVRGPLAMAQILESPLLNHLNYQTLVATKASRIHEAGRGGTVIEFGMRRAQGRGANAGVRAALIGGADFSSNTGISCVLGSPPKGTHAHSMVQVFMAMGAGEEEAFRAYADVYPDDCLLLVDTVNTLESGIPNAIRVFEELRRRGHKPVGIRLDSGDLAYLGIQAARMLNEAGFPETIIVLSNELDEMVIWQIVHQIEQEAAQYGLDPDHVIKRLVYGVGTRLIVSKGASALDGVYKLVAVREGGSWLPAIKFSENVQKILNPGPKMVWRIYDERGMATADLVGSENEDPSGGDTVTLRHPTEHGKSRTLTRGRGWEMEPLLIDIMREGKVIHDPPEIEKLRERRQNDLARLDAGVKRLVNPHIYHVSLTEKLWQLKQDLIERFRREPRSM